MGGSAHRGGYAPFSSPRSIRHDRPIGFWFLVLRVSRPWGARPALTSMKRHGRANRRMSPERSPAAHRTGSSSRSRVSAAVCADQLPVRQRRACYGVARAGCRWSKVRASVSKVTSGNSGYRLSINELQGPMPIHAFIEEGEAVGTVAVRRCGLPVAMFLKLPRIRGQREM